MEKKIRIVLGLILILIPSFIFITIFRPYSYQSDGGGIELGLISIYALPLLFILVITGAALLVNSLQSKKVRLSPVGIILLILVLGFFLSRTIFPH